MVACRRRNALVVGSAPLMGPGGVESVCRSLVRLFEQREYCARYVSGTELVLASRLQHLPARRLWWGIAENLLSASISRRPSLPDVVVTNGPIGWRVKGGLSIHYYHGTYVAQAEAVRAFIRPRGYMKMRYVDGMGLERLAGAGKLCVANSQQTAEEVRRHFGYECVVVWCPVDTGTFAPGPRDRELLAGLGVPEGRPIGLFVGAGRPVKGARYALEVVRRMPRVTWLVIGEANSQLAVDERGVLFRARVLPRDMPALLRSVDFLLVTSLYESFGLLAAEALACGTPVVTGPIGAAQLFTEGGYPDRFVLPDPRNIEGLRSAVEQLLDEPLPARQAALEARTHIERTLSLPAWGEGFVRAVGLPAAAD